MKKLIFILLFLLKFYTSYAVEKDSLTNELLYLSKQISTIDRDSTITKALQLKLKNTSITKLKEWKFWLDSLEKFSFYSKWNQTIANKHFSKSTYYYYIGNSKKAISELEASIKLFKIYNNITGYIASVTNLSTIISLNLLNFKITDQAQLKKYYNFLNESLIEVYKTKNSEYIATQEITMGLYNLNQTDYNKALIHFSKAHILVSKEPSKYFYEFNISNAAKGLCLLYLNNKKKGLALMENTKIIGQKTKRPNNEEKYLLTMVGLFLSKYYVHKEEYEKAIKEANEAYIALETFKMPFFYNQLNQVLYESHRKLKHNDLALKYFEQIHDYMLKEENKNFKAEFAEYQLKYNDEKQTATIKTLENQKLLKENESKDMTRNVLIFSLLAGLGLIGYIYQNNIKLSQKNTQLSTKNKEIEEALFKGQTIERKRIGVELHDNLSAKIGAIRWRLESLEPKFKEKTDTDFYNTTINALNETYADVRLIAHNLLPEILEDKGLIIATQNLIDELNSFHKTKFTYEAFGKLQRYPNKIEYELYSILLELSNNILKHANAENANITIYNNPNELKLIVKDDGIGFEKENLKYGMGLNNIKSRLESISGSLQFESEKGMRVEILVAV